MGQKKKIFSDIVWSVLGLAAMHAVLQIVLYPSLNKYLGQTQFGEILYILAILGILAPSIGLAANDTRLIERNKILIENGDFLLAMFPQMAVALLLFIALTFRYVQDLWGMLLLCVTLGLTMLREYGSVEYKLSLNYKGYFLYYLCISCGYILGVVLFPILRNWIVCFFFGELFCFLLVLSSGHIYRPLALSGNQKYIFNRILILAASYLLYNTVLYLDRILLQNLIDSESVTLFYIASLLGKTTALLVGPLNGVMIGYLTKDGSRITKGLFLKWCGTITGIGMALYGIIILATPIFTRLLYPSLSAAVLEFAWLANLSQIVCFIAAPLLTIMLISSGPKWQLMIQSVYAAEFVGLGILGAEIGGLWGFIWAGLAANMLRLVLIISVGYVQIGKQIQRI